MVSDWVFLTKIQMCCSNPSDFECSWQNLRHINPCSREVLSTSELQLLFPLQHEETNQNMENWCNKCNIASEYEPLSVISINMKIKYSISNRVNSNQNPDMRFKHIQLDCSQQKVKGNKLLFKRSWFINRTPTPHSFTAREVGSKYGELIQQVLHCKKTYKKLWIYAELI